MDGLTLNTSSQSHRTAAISSEGGKGILNVDTADNQLVPVEDGALALAGLTDNRILSEMVDASLVLAKKKPPLRIVVLDDEQETLNMHERNIRSRLKEVTVLAFKNVFDALDELSRTTPSLFITDINHPGLSGEKMFERLAEMNVNCPIFIVSGNMEREALGRILCLPLKLTAVLPKPFKAKAFWEALDSCLFDVPPKPFLR